MSDEYYKFNSSELWQQAKHEVSLHENIWLQAWSEIRAGHKQAVNNIVSLCENNQITSEEAQELITLATDMAIKDSTPKALFKSGDISERTYRLLTNQYGSLDPLK